MQDMRELLSREPMTFNEFLDMFEAYVSTIGGPLTKANHLIGDELHYQGGDIFFHITGTVDNADDMAKRLRGIRAARNTGTDVTITLTEIEHRLLDTAIIDVIDLLGDAANTLALLSEANLDTASPLRLLGRALRTADQIEVPALMMVDGKIRSAVSSLCETKRQAVIEVGEAA